MPRKAGSLVSATCRLCGVVERVSGSGGKHRCAACKDAGRVIPSSSGFLGLGKDFAGARVQEAVREGRIPHPRTLKCADCQQPAEQYEHRDYNKPLMVEPICRSCNLKRGPAVPLWGSLQAKVRSGYAPYRRGADARRVLHLIGVTGIELPGTVRHSDWVRLLPLIEAAHPSGKPLRDDAVNLATDKARA